MIPRITFRHVPLIATIGVCLLLYTIASCLYPGFFALQVFVNFLADNSFLGIIAVGMTLVIISGGIDLSVGAVMALCSMMMAVMMTRGHISPPLAIAAGLAAGTVLGWLMGCAVHYFRLAAFIVTLAGMFLARGLTQIISLESEPIRNPFYTSLSSPGLPIGSAHLPVTAMVFLVTVIAGVYVSSYTRFGRNVFAVGGNEDAATLMGLPVGRTRILVHTVSGFCAGLAAVVYTIYQSAGNPTAGVGLELDAISVVVIGGTLLTGGAGWVAGTFVGTLIFGIIQTAIMFQGTLNSWWTKVAVGVLLLLFILLQKLLSRRAEAGAR